MGFIALFIKIHQTEMKFGSFELFKEPNFFFFWIWGLNAWKIYGLKEYANVHIHFEILSKFREYLDLLHLFTFLHLVCFSKFQ